MNESNFEDQVVFRPSKKRKTLRQRQTDEDDGSTSLTHRSNVPRPDDDATLSSMLVPALTRRAPAKVGVGFSSSKKAVLSTDDAGLDAPALQRTVVQPDANNVAATAGRFIAATGQVAVEDDRHM